MPEAVIVDTVRSPIGRAFKGSLAQLRPEETGAYVIDQLLERNQEVDPDDRQRGLRRLRHAAGPAGLQRRPDHDPALREAPEGDDGGDDVALLRVQPRLDPPRRQLDQGRPGRHLRRRRGRVGEPVQRAHRARRRRRPQPEPDRRERPAQRLHRHGHHGRQRRQEVRGQPRRHGQVRAALPGARRQVPGGRLLRPRDRRGQGPGRQRGRQGRRPARQLDPREALRAARGVRGRRRRHRRQLMPAQRRRRGGAGDVRGARQGAGPEAARQDRSPRPPTATSPS